MVRLAMSVQTTLVEEKEPSEEVLAAQGQSPSEVKGGESGEETEEEGSEKDSNETTQRILTIMANFIDGEVSLFLSLTKYIYLPICQPNLHVYW